MSVGSVVHKESFPLKNKRRTFDKVGDVDLMQMLAFCCVHIALAVPECWANIFIHGQSFILKSTPCWASQYEHRALGPELCGILLYRNQTENT